MKKAPEFRDGNKDTWGIGTLGGSSIIVGNSEDYEEREERSRIG